jgi:serine/threonine-protein kinase HipA
MNRCLCCGKDTTTEEGSYHGRCLKALFHSGKAPIMDYSWQELNQMATQIIQQRISVPGVQPKLSVHLEKDHKLRADRLTLVGLDGDYILKPPSTKHPFLPEAEHFCMTFARLVDIKTEDFGLITLKSGELSFIARRMDRTKEGPLHMEDFCQLTNKLTEQKYRGSMEQVGKALREFSSTPGLDAIRFFELALFCYLTGNSDMHLKNFSLLRERNGSYQLAPAYDLVPSQIILPEDKEEFALTLTGRKAKIRRHDFEVFGQTIKLTDTQIRNAIKRIVSIGEKNLSEALVRSFLPVDKRKEISQLFADRMKKLQP